MKRDLNVSPIGTSGKQRWYVEEGNRLNPSLVASRDGVRVEVELGEDLDQARVSVTKDGIAESTFPLRDWEVIVRVIEDLCVRMSKLAIMRDWKKS